MQKFFGLFMETGSCLLAFLCFDPERLFFVVDEFNRLFLTKLWTTEDPSLQKLQSNLKF